MNTVSSNRRTPLKGLGTIVLALFLVMAMWVPIFATHLMVSIQTGNQTVDGGTALSLLATSSDDVTTHAWTADPAVGTFSERGCRRYDLDGAGYNDGRPGGHVDPECDRRRGTPLLPLPVPVS